MDTSIVLDPNRWYHFAAVHNGQDRQYLYINGIERANAESRVPIFVNAPVTIGYHVDGSGPVTFPGYIQHFRISNVARYDFPYARVDVPPTVALGGVQTPPIVGTPDLAVLNIAAYSNPSGGTLVQAIVQNQGSRDTQNGFYTDLYLDHLPSGTGIYSGSVQFWVNDPIAAGATVTLTTVITDLLGVSGASALNTRSLNEVSGMLYAQVDSTGVVSETDNLDNIYSAGAEICIASADTYEGDDSFSAASTMSLSQTQTHNFNGPADHDWIKFNAQGGVTYTLRTLNLGVSADTYLYLYSGNGTTLLTSNDDYGGSLASQIDWVAPTTGTYYLLIQHWNPNVGGCGTSYSVSFALQQRWHILFLPVVLRSPGG